MARTEVKIGGFGGQGVVLAGTILGHAATKDGKWVAGASSYGAQARGGSARTDVVISDGEIDHPEVLSADVVVALSQEAYKKFAKSVRPGGLLILDEDRVVIPEPVDAPPGSGLPIGLKTVKIPVVYLAQETTGKAITANTVALGVLVGLTGVVSKQAIEKAVTARAPKGTEEMNRKALEAGFAAAEQVKASLR